MRLRLTGRREVTQHHCDACMSYSGMALIFILCYLAGVILILASNKEKGDMELELHANFKPDARKGSTFLCRVGEPTSMVDLRRVACHDAKSVIVMCEPEGEPEAADSGVVHTVLALCSLIGHNSETQIVAEIRDVDSKRVVQAVRDEIEVVVSHDIVGRLMIMSVRQPGSHPSHTYMPDSVASLAGLARVYEEILGFDGDEFYLQEWPEACGCPFGDLAGRFPDAIPIGVKTADGTIVLNPERHRRMRRSEQILVIAEDDDTYDLVSAKPIRVTPAKDLEPALKQVEKILFCGWRRDARDIIMLLDDLVAHGTEIHIMCEVPVEERTEILKNSGLNFNNIRNIELLHHFGNTSARRKLETLPIEQYTSCLVFADELLEQDPMSSDRPHVSQHVLLLLLYSLSTSLAVIASPHFCSYGIFKLITHEVGGLCSMHLNAQCCVRCWMCKHRKPSSRMEPSAQCASLCKPTKW